MSSEVIVSTVTGLAESDSGETITLHLAIVTPVDEEQIVYLEDAFEPAARAARAAAEELGFETVVFDSMRNERVQDAEFIQFDYTVETVPD